MLVAELHKVANVGESCIEVALLNESLDLAEPHGCDLGVVSRELEPVPLVLVLEQFSLRQGHAIQGYLVSQAQVGRKEVSRQVVVTEL